LLPHEHTTPKARSDRLDLLRSTHANLSPVWGLSLASGLSKLLDPAAATPLGQWQDGDGIAHELWRVSDPDTIGRIIESVSSASVVIADGHHRYETCLAFAAERPDLAGVNATLCYVVELAPDQLTVQPIHRLVRGVSLADLETALATEYELDDDDASGLALVTPDATRPLRRRDTATTSTRSCCTVRSPTCRPSTSRSSTGSTTSSARCDQARPTRGSCCAR